MIPWPSLLTELVLLVGVLLLLVEVLLALVGMLLLPDPGGPEDMPALHQPVQPPGRAQHPSYSSSTS